MGSKIMAVTRTVDLPERAQCRSAGSTKMSGFAVVASRHPFEMSLGGDREESRYCFSLHRLPLPLRCGIPDTECNRIVK